METKQRGRPRKMIPPPETDSDKEFVAMYNHFLALKKAQRAYYQRNKTEIAEKRMQKILETTGGVKPRIGRPKKKNEEVA